MSRDEFLRHYSIHEIQDMLTYNRIKPTRDDIRDLLHAELISILISANGGKGRIEDYLHDWFKEPEQVTDESVMSILNAFDERRGTNN